MNASMISRRVGVSLTPRPYSEPEKSWAEREGRAGIDAMLLLELLLQAVVEERQQQLLTARVEAGGSAVQGNERLVLEEPGDPARIGEVAVLARVADRHGFLTLCREDDAVAGESSDRGHRGRRHDRAGERRAEGVRKEEQGGEQREG